MNIDLHHHLIVKSKSGILIKAGGKIQGSHMVKTALCIQNGNSCDSTISKILTARGFTLTSTNSIPSDMSQYNLVVLTDLGQSLINNSAPLKNYVNSGGGLVFLAGSAYWLQFSDPSWLGYSSADYTLDGESASVSLNNPFETSLMQGDLLKQQGPTEHGAQYVTGVSGTIVGTFSGDGIYAYYANYGSGKVYFQSDLNTSSGFNDKDNAQILFGAALDYVKKK